MKNLFRLSVLLLLVFSTSSLRAQSDERNKIQMVIAFESKTITVDLANVGIGITRYKDYQEGGATAEPAKEKSLTQGNYYLTLSVKKMNNDFLKLLSKKQTLFSGTITITDSYGKNPPREIKFSNASMDGYSDQFSNALYEDVYSTASVTLSTNGFTINGVVME